MSSKISVRIATERGEVLADLHEDKAPTTTANFLYYVDNEFYQGGRFWRTVTLENQPDSDVRIEVIQGGVHPARSDEIRDPIPLERTSETGLAHLDGTISMGRFAPDSAHSEFFICIGDQPELNLGGRRNPDGQGFAAFGQVTRGMDVVRSIQQSNYQGQRLVPPIEILKIERVR